ncbi:4Fe-4S binding protein [Thiohalorhabdus denitrificans]|uniref:Polyferredoxin n=1 Tax=Thiohalorhabdus denitrificans TaxID=381306 RepID=A0A1G5HE92_9GAMM|nr:4Fe-4S binding protein [Thiohalorhabdus denitrificans]SCY61328.1 Polyferredoxin [Thiohalorhabdus denitrificans]
MGALQDRRRLTRLGFFALFVLAPPLDLFRIDLTLGHAILFGQDWTLGLGPFVAGEASALEAGWNLFWRFFLPVFGGAALFLLVAWRWGRLYCGWLCPHFSVVETVNGLMERSIGRPSLWEPKPLPARRADGGLRRSDRRLWPVTLLAAAGFALLWAVVLLTYLLPPATVYGNLVTAELTRNQALFIGVATTLFLIDFLAARHFFCRYGCAVGLFQSLVWLANRRAMVVGFDRARAADCASCNAACDNACPMRLKPRTIKRHMFACTQCAQCITACETVQANNPEGSLLRWVDGECALDVSAHDFGHRPEVPPDCFRADRTAEGPRIVYED